ncbi:MAG: hypothetical protein A2365_04085 [Candidatus Nealsonbacteria bacterium RIFOXYB1_FULL_40_15]|uniref:DNA polymerase III subunit delta n=2 Tax=Candidatus Nealsoniibacteriota TaxID=1817911 RepID=A0A1G2EMT4_9BACT|nr:MAG: hypothetical protein A2427_04430 [Candidatus Nealsonbacteria bacterium RIFOXYC1_FULL_40_7]OGZ27786.1 MAG: hypothetical protein A2365_04085 [Candidatus Nealsonbacteria bacterium RIFOXYB1_FULL_40_15]OGZ28627.1 MAG: hypothetical protein A2562_03785 [Candidatus Nealsonbacteria bacterium RIFOXYD1_FULL_39_11]
MFEKQLKMLVAAERLPHALLFCGQEKIGKTEFALRFAEKLASGPDLIVVEPEKEVISIKKIRELLEKLIFKPYNSETKIAVIRDAHLMNREAQNCFLKFMEEPFEKTNIILVSSYPYLLLDTILSRVQKIRFYAKIEEDPKNIELIKLIQSDLSDRFKFAKDSEEKNIEKILDDWVFFLRNAMLKKIKGESMTLDGYPAGKIKEIIENIQKTKTLVASTNINRRLALETLLLNI